MKTRTVRNNTDYWHISINKDFNLRITTRVRDQQPKLCTLSTRGSVHAGVPLPTGELACYDYTPAVAFHCQSVDHLRLIWSRKSCYKQRIFYH